MDEGSESKIGGNVPQDGSAYPNVVSVTHVLIRDVGSRQVPAPDEIRYQAVVIRDRDRIFYRAMGVVVPITEYEAKQVVRNPFTYYFSTALKLHLRIERAMKRKGFWE